jgi:hypothetical protein
MVRIRKDCWLTIISRWSEILFLLVNHNVDATRTINVDIIVYYALTLILLYLVLNKS